MYGPKMIGLLRIYLLATCLHVTVDIFQNIKISNIFLKEVLSKIYNLKEKLPRT